MSAVEQRVYYHREDNRRRADRNVGECTWLVVSSDASQQSGAHRRKLPVCALVSRGVCDVGLVFWRVERRTV